MARLFSVVALILCMAPPAGADSSWARSLAPADELIERMRRLRLGGLLWDTPADLGFLRSQARDLRKKLDEAENPPPGIGVFFDDKSTRVSQLLIGGPAESAGLSIGDEIASVDGQPVADNMGVVRRVNEATGPIELALKNRPGKVRLAKKPPEYLSAGFLAGLESRCRALLEETVALEGAAARPGADAAALLARAEEVAAGIRRLKDELLQAQIRAFTTRYRSR